MVENHLKRGVSMFAYIGCRTTRERNARGKGISIFNVTNNVWRYISTVHTKANPSYLGIDRTGQYLYAVHGDFNCITSYAIQADGNLQYMSEVNAMGNNPVYITINKSNTFAFVATLQGGTVASFPIKPDGSLGEAASVQHLSGQDAANVSFAHQCEFDRSGNFLFVPTQARHVGYERIWVFAVCHKTGALTLVDSVQSRCYSEPRHVVVSADNRRVYLVNEKGNSVTYYEFCENTGRLTPVQIVSSLPETYTGEGQASAIILDRREEFLYATNRLHDSIAMYRINKHTGFLTSVGWVSAMGQTPRFGSRVPDSDEIVVANEDSDTLQFFKVQEASGYLTFLDKTVHTESPTCIVFNKA